MLQVNLGFAWVPDESKSGYWEEVYYVTGDTIQAGVDKLWETQGILGRARTSMIGRRLQCLAKDCYLYFVRIAVVGSRGVAQVFNQSQQGFASGVAIVNDEDTEYAGTAVCQKLNGNVEGIKRYVRIGGVPDQVLKSGIIKKGWYTGQVFNGFADTTTFLGKWIAAGLQIRYRTARLGGASSYNILSAAKDGQYGLVTLTTTKPTAFDQAVPVVVSTRSQPQIRGTWRVAYSPTAGVCKLAGSERISCPETLSGLVTLGSVSFTTIKEVEPPFLSGHKLGKKKNQRRGRQSAKLLRH